MSGKPQKKVSRIKRSDAEKAEVVKLLRNGWRVSEISRFLGFPRSTVSCIVQRARNRGTIVPEATQKWHRTKAVQKRHRTKGVQKRPHTRGVQKRPQIKAIVKEPQTKAVQKRHQTKGVEKRPQTKAVEKRPQTKAAVKRPQRKAAGKTEAVQKRQTIKRSEAEKAEVVRLSQKGWNSRQIASLMNFPVSTVFNIVKRARDTACISGAVQNMQHTAQENGPTNKQKKQTMANKICQTGGQREQAVSHTAKMIGSLRMKIQAVAGKTHPTHRQGMQTVTRKAKLMGTQRMKEQMQMMAGKFHPTSRQGMQTVSQEAKVVGALRIMEMMDTGTHPTSRQETQADSQNVKVTHMRRRKGRVFGKYGKHSLALKMKVLQRFDQGERERDIAGALGIAVSTVRSMCKSKCLRKLYKQAACSDIQRGARGGREGADVDEGVDVTRGDVKEEVEVGIEEDVEEGVDGGVATVPPKDVVMESMERLLKIWIDGQVTQGCVVRDGAIQTKALSLWQFVYDGLTCREARGVADKFEPSAAWLRQFKEGAGLHTLPSCPSHSSISSLEAHTHQATLAHVSVEEAAAPGYQKRGEGKSVVGHPSQRMSEGVTKEFSSLLRAKIELGGYTASQVINIVETRLCWKRLPTNTVIILDSITSQGPRASRDSFSLLLGANATGDLKLKPLLVYHLEKPSSLAGYTKEHLPVFWRTHPRARLTAALWQNYVVEYLSQRCREYAAQRGLENRFLLVVEATHAHPPSMDDWAENIEVIILSPNNNTSCNTTNDSITVARVKQPMGQGVSSTFSLCYLHHVFEQLIRETNSSSNDHLSSVCAFWRAYSIKKALGNIKMAWDDVTPSTLNAAWQNVWPDFVDNFLAQKVERELSEVSEDAVVSLAHQAGFLLVTVQDVRDWKDSHGQDPHNSRQSNMHPNLTLNQEIGKQCEEEEEEGEEGRLVKTLDVRSLCLALNLLEDTMAVFENNDPNVTRSCDARAVVEAGVKVYRELLAAKKRKAQSSSIFSAVDHKQQQQ